MVNENQSGSDDRTSSDSVNSEKRGFLKKVGATLGGLTFGSASLSSSAKATHKEHKHPIESIQLGEDTHILNTNRSNSGNSSANIGLDAGLSSANTTTNRSMASVNVTPFPLGGSGTAKYFGWTGFDFVAEGDRPRLAHITSRGKVGGYLEAAGPATASVDVGHHITDIKHNRHIQGGTAFSESADLLTINFNDESNHLAQTVNQSFRDRQTVNRLRPGHKYRVRVPLTASTVTKGGEAASNFHPDAQGITGPLRGSGIGAGLGEEGGYGLKLHEIKITFP